MKKLHIEKLFYIVFNSGVKGVMLNDDGDDGFFGPALPPGFKKQGSSPEK